MLEEEWNKITLETYPRKNLKYALLALGYAVLAGLAAYLAIDAFGPQTSLNLIRVFVGLYYVLTIVSGGYAFLACRNSLKSLKSNKDIRNYIALVIGGLLLLGILRQIIRLL